MLNMRKPTKLRSLILKLGFLRLMLSKSVIRSSAVPCLHKDFILGNINSEEKWFLSRGRAWDGLLSEDVCCLGELSCPGTFECVCLTVLW